MDQRVKRAKRLHGVRTPSAPTLTCSRCEQRAHKRAHSGFDNILAVECSLELRVALGGQVLGAGPVVVRREDVDEVRRTVRRLHLHIQLPLW